MEKTPQIGLRLQGDVSVIDIKGDVTPIAGPPIEAAYREATSSGAKKILFVFAHDGYINSGGIAILIGILSESKKHAQTIRITGLSAHFQKIFGMVGLTKYAQIHSSEEAALAAF